VTTSVFRRRRAERLAQLLDEAGGSPRHHSRTTHDPELAGYVQISERLARIARLLPDPSADFRASLRAQLVARAERDGIGGRAGNTWPGTAPSPSSSLLGDLGRILGGHH
jgi:hypothetical protein